MKKSDTVGKAGCVICAIAGHAIEGNEPREAAAGIGFAAAICGMIRGGADGALGMCCELHRRGVQGVLSDMLMAAVVGDPVQQTKEVH